MGRRRSNGTCKTDPIPLHCGEAHSPIALADPRGTLKTRSLPRGNLGELEHLGLRDREAVITGPHRFVSPRNRFGGNGMPVSPPYGSSRPCSETRLVVQAWESMSFQKRWPGICRNFDIPWLR